MGYQVMIVKFVEGEPGLIPFDEFSKVLNKYGEIVEYEGELEFLSSVGDLCDWAPIIGNKIDGISGITFDRPTIHKQLPDVIFDVLDIENTCFFDPNMEFIQSRYEMTEDLPGGFLDVTEDKITVVSSPLEHWPL